MKNNLNRYLECVMTRVKYIFFLAQMKCVELITQRSEDRKLAAQYHSLALSVIFFFFSISQSFRSRSAALRHSNRNKLELYLSTLDSGAFWFLLIFSILHKFLFSNNIFSICIYFSVLHFFSLHVISSYSFYPALLASVIISLVSNTKSLALYSSFHSFLSLSFNFL